VISIENEAMWKLISEYEENLQNRNSTEYFDKLLDSLNTIERKDIRFATLIEVGNLAANNERRRKIFKKQNCRYM